MNKQHGKASAVAQEQQAPSASRLSAAEVKTRLREQQGLTLKAWAAKNKFPYDTVSCVVRGINRGTYGMGHRIAIQLGIKRA